MQIGSDGVQACASCHFHAGADNRIVSQKNPGLNRVAGTQVAIKNAINPSHLIANPDTTFTNGGPNTQLTLGHFPLGVDSSAAAGPNFGNNDIVSSQGVNAGTFTSLSGGRFETGTYANVDPHGFNANSNTVRRVPPRNSPSAVGAVFNLRNFWDGRANLFFNGVNPFGMLDPATRVVVVNQSTFTEVPGGLQLMIPFSSLASQAVGPPLSDFEMSLTGRGFQHIAEKVLRPLPTLVTPGFTPLDRQAISTADSVLGSGPTGLNLTSGVGLNVSYIDLIKDVFQEKFWKANAAGDDLSVMKRNFALFFGLAVQAYEATLIPSDTPVDDLLQTLNGAQPDAQSGNPVERGLAIFLSGRASCSACHFGSETTSASVSHLTGFGDPALEAAPAGVPVPPVALAERMVMGDGSKSAYDTGFYNIGVRPTKDDLSIFNRVNNVPFSFGMLAQEILRGNPAVGPVNTLLTTPGALQLPTSSTNLSPLPFAITVACAPGGRGQALGVVNGNGCRPLNTNEHIAIRGSFKTPNLRNLKFHGPYFHNGSAKSIQEAVEFYDRGGDFNLAFNPDGCKNNNKNCIIGQVDFDAEIAARGFTPLEISDLVAFLNALTDRRVARDAAPFDHPQLCLPNGHDASNGNATILVDLPAVGAGGHSSDILTFEETLAGVTGRPHAMSNTTTCTMFPLPTQP